MGNWTHPLPTNVTSIDEMLVYTNNVTEQLFGLTMLIVIFIISFSYMKQYYRTQECLVASSFITMISTILFFIIGIVPESYIIWTILLSIAAIFLAASK